MITGAEAGAEAEAEAEAAMVAWFMTKIYLKVLRRTRARWL
jgi:hypothetical protein